MKAIIGLGNPGEKYQRTRHNIGFDFVDYLAQKYDAGQFKEKSELRSLVAEARIGAEKVLLVKPLTFMNVSGEAVQLIKNYYKLDLTDLVIVYDDIDLPFGTVRYREEGSAGTHNGMRSIIGVLGLQEIPRLRLGVEARSDELKEKWPLKDYVLSRFSDEEWGHVEEIFEEGLTTLPGYDIM